jgi:hypothetical protein
MALKKMPGLSITAVPMLLRNFDMEVAIWNAMVGQSGCMVLRPAIPREKK